MLRTADLDFELPEGLVAQAPVSPRDAARMLVLSRSNPALLEHVQVRRLPEYLRRGDLLVMNATRVVPARFEGVRVDTGGRVEGLWLESLAGEPRRWVVMLRGKRLREGIVVGLTSVASGSVVQLSLLGRVEGNPGAWTVLVQGPAAEEEDADVLARAGLTPLPPYILNARRKSGLVVSDSEDRDRYQTVFAHDWEGPARASVAAPTAGLHLTPELLSTLGERGVGVAQVVLHVGLGTFKGVETEFVEQHPMHAEWCCVPPETWEAIQRTRREGGRVFGVGTTAVRTLEAFAGLGLPPGEWFETRLLITPGYEFRVVDGLLTNFHLPRTTLLAMVGALLGSVDRLRAAYAVAVAERYRFFSYGDAMLVTP